MQDQHDGSTLRDFFENKEHRLIHKWLGYFEVYERHFARFRNKPITLMEFGVLHGGSLQMWKWYFGEQAQIHGVDINPRCAELAEDRVTIHIADQEDRNSLRKLTQTIPQCDIIIDDGGHTMLQQKHTFEELWGHLKEGGVYLCEDLSTSYWKEFGGGYRNPDSFIEYTKNFIDSLNAWWSHEDHYNPDPLTLSAFSVHFYGGIVVLEKRAMTVPEARMRGTPSFPLTAGEQKSYDRGR
ncbi:class I SAM-dependent methyltransferase [Pseudoduganella sp. RAF53_2]|uniref:class I SAM-dependent methyltransferase n=1 Tax=unclassified Pseudoduganella TaxID=2637179 RepID=UPI003F9BFEB4